MTFVYARSPCRRSEVLPRTERHRLRHDPPGEVTREIPPHRIASHAVLEPCGNDLEICWRIWWEWTLEILIVMNLRCWCDFCVNHQKTCSKCKLNQNENNREIVDSLIRYYFLMYALDLWNFHKNLHYQNKFDSGKQCTQSWRLIDSDICMPPAEMKNWNIYLQSDFNARPQDAPRNCGLVEILGGQVAQLHRNLLQRLALRQCRLRDLRSAVIPSRSALFASAIIPLAKVCNNYTRHLCSDFRVRVRPPRTYSIANTDFNVTRTWSDSCSQTSVVVHTWLTGWLGDPMCLFKAVTSISELCR